ncbi:MAG: TonB-dependent receptor, partial [Balneolaceae bacterium]
DSNFHKENKVNVMSNWKLRLDKQNSISFKNLFNQIGENETIIRNGFDFIQRPDDNLRNYMLGYRSRTIYTGQIEGIHDINQKNSLRWVAGGGFLREEEPDLRRFRTFRSQQEPDANFSMQMPPSSNLFDTGRYFGDLNEYSLNHGADYTRFFSGSLASVKAGYLVDYRDRDFSSRYMSYLYPGFFDPNIREDLIRLPLGEIFNRDNVRNMNGFVLEEGTRPIDSYTASSLTTAGYISAEIPMSRVTVITGIRIENNVQKLNSRDDFEDITVNNPILSYLPFFNSTYRIKDGTQLRLAYGRTINRPEFRELAPFVFYDYKMDAGRAGNPGLRHATIDNVDLRLELYPRLGETITLGAFFKYFDSPIENKTTVTTESPQFSYINADYAISYGVELEIRKSFIGLTDSEFLDRFSVNANGSLIFTKVDLGGGAVAQEQVRPLQGQSPYIINSAIYYDDQKNGFATSIVYNIIGPRIFSVGDVLFPSIYEMPRHSIDISMMKKIGSHTTLKAGIQDLLNAPNRFYQDSNRNDKIESGTDHPIVTYRGGQLVNITFTYNFGM